jgi:hypothetical protein
MSLCSCGVELTTPHSCQPATRHPTEVQQSVLCAALEPFGLAIVVSQGDKTGLTFQVLWKGRIIERALRIEAVADCRGITRAGTLPNGMARLVVRRATPECGEPDYQALVLEELGQSYPWLSIVVEEPSP